MRQQCELERVKSEGTVRGEVSFPSSFFTRTKLLKVLNSSYPQLLVRMSAVFGVSNVAFFRVLL